MSPVGVLIERTQSKAIGRTMAGLLRLREIGKYVDDLYRSFFTGAARRGGEYPSDKYYRLEFEVDRPLHLYKNIYRIGKVFSVYSTLVVSREILDLIGPMGCVVEPVVFDRPYWLEYDTKRSSFDHFGFKDWRVGQKKLYSQPIDLSLSDGLQYFAVFPRRDEDVLSERLNLASEEVAVRMESLSPAEVLRNISVAEIESQGVIYSSDKFNGWVLSSRISRTLQTEIDTYFMELKSLRL